MDIREMLDTLGSFMAGLGNKSDIDVNNAVFIAKELLDLNLPLQFRGAGRHGVKSLELYGLLRRTTPTEKNEKAFSSGKMLSGNNSRELMLMASYLWNEGRSSLDETERGEAFELLKDRFRETRDSATPSTATASG